MADPISNPSAFEFAKLLVPAVVLLMMLHPTQELEPPANPARFRSPV